MSSFSSRDLPQPPCPFHGAHEAMTNVCEETRKLWASRTDKLFESPDAIENLSVSLHLSQYADLSEGMQTFLKFFYDNVHQIKAERFTNLAFKNVTIIRHKVQSNESKMMMLGCKHCNKMTEELYFASSYPEFQQDALKVLRDFFGPYCPEVHSFGSGREVLCRSQYWHRYWEGPKSRVLTSPRGPISAFSTKTFQAALEATPIEGAASVDRKPVTMEQSTYKCHPNGCGVQRSVIHPPSPVSPSSGSSSDSSSLSEEDFGRLPLGS